MTVKSIHELICKYPYVKSAFYISLFDQLLKNYHEHYKQLGNKNSLQWNLKSIIESQMSRLH